ncbi:hypothetical protein M3Y98_00737400 [Aphelenchoides besseyi]|nr:hypothetical protein M3Y98_00737400 [Aphelenchoides besseyi]KAI6211429.1 hypothetical protein M3Y96_00433200 [Aphelenchoides besseyi]
MRTLSYLLVVALALIGWKQGLGLKCYFCAPDDYFFKGATTCDKPQIKECYPDVTTCIKGVPSKSTGLTSGIYKTCYLHGFGVASNLTGCEQKQTGMICGCHSDLCNSSNRPIFSLTAFGFLRLVLNVFALEINVY